MDIRSPSTQQLILPPRPPSLRTYSPPSLIERVKKYVIWFFSKIGEWLAVPFTYQEITSASETSIVQKELQKIEKAIIEQKNRVVKIKTQIENQEITDWQGLTKACDDLANLSLKSEYLKKMPTAFQQLPEFKEALEAEKQLEEAEKSFCSLCSNWLTAPIETTLKNQDLLEAGKLWLQSQEVNDSLNQSLSTQNNIEGLEKHVIELFLREETLNQFVQWDPVGIPNIGNSCYLNSSCQLLFSSKSLVRQIFSNQPTEKQGESAIALRKALQKLAVHYYICQQEKKPIEKSFMEKLRFVLFTGKDYFDFEDINDQHAADECLGFLVDSFESEPLQILTTRYSGEVSQACGPEKNNLLMLPMQEEPWSMNPIQNLFLSLFSCDEKSPEKEKKLTIENMAQTFFERHQEDEAWKNFDKYEEERHLFNQPEVLLISVKRAQKNGEKLCGQIEIPNEIDIAPFLGKSVKQQFPTKYKLRAHVTHEGTSSLGGHYIAHALKENNQWYYASDSTIQQTESDIEDREKGIIYLYERMD